MEVALLVEQLAGPHVTPCQEQALTVLLSHPADLIHVELPLVDRYRSTRMRSSVLRRAGLGGEGDSACAICKDQRHTIISPLAVRQRIEQLKCAARCAPILVVDMDLES